MANLLTAYGKKLLDPRWQKVRLEVLNNDKFTCQFCGDTETTLHVHHLCYNTETKNPWDVPKTALICICENCHKVEHLKNTTSLEKDLIKIIRDVALTSLVKNDALNKCIRAITQTILKHNG